MDFNRVLQEMVDRDASDLLLKVGTPPHVRIRGALLPVGSEVMTRADLWQIADDLLGAERQHVVQAQREANFAFERESLGRFRTNVMWQRGNLAFVIRRVRRHIEGFRALNLPEGPLSRLTREPRGLVLIAGPTGSGKSTTSAAMLEVINEQMPCHIVTLEDPIEVVFEERRAVINQREIGVDTRSFSDGLKHVLRQSPDVLFLSDLRDREAMEAALVAAESGQLVLTCIHTTNVPTTIERLVTFFPPHQHEAVRLRLSLVLKGIVCLRLLTQADEQGQVPACEILIATPRVREVIREGHTDQLPALLREGAIHGMQTLTQSLEHLVRNGRVTREAALQAADQPEELTLALQQIRGMHDG